MIQCLFPKWVRTPPARLLPEGYTEADEGKEGDRAAEKDC